VGERVNKFLMVIPPNVSLEMMVGSKKQFATKLRKEIPMGAVSIATYIKKFYGEWQYQIIDFNIILDKEKDRKEFCKNTKQILLDNLKKYYSKDDEDVLIGISAIFNATFPYINIISRVCREIWHDAFIYAGGFVPSNLYKETFESAPFLQAINYGEGELPILKYMQASEKEEFLRESESWITREKLQQDFEPKHDFLHDLDEIPTLDYSLVEFEKYSGHVHAQTMRRVISAPLMFSRGCPFNCCFCASHSIHGKKVRYNSLDRIIEDIKAAKEKYKVNTLVVWDDNFFVDMNRAYALLDYCEQLDIKFEFANSFPVYRMDENLIMRLKRAGVEVASLAIESGCQRVLNEVMHKGHVKLEMVRKAIELLHKHGFYVKGMFVIGLPGETKAELEETVEFIKTAGLNWVDVFSASPIAGSELYEICKKNNYLDADGAEKYDFYTSCIRTEEFTPEEIEKIQLETVLFTDYVNNWDMKNENYQTAYINFEYVMKSNPDNPFAFYFAGECAGKMGDIEGENALKRTAAELVHRSVKWDELIKMFGIQL